MPAELSFLARPSSPEGVGTPEGIGEQERALARGIRAFMDREVLPRSESLEAGSTEVLMELFALAAEVGLTGLGIPERHGGVGASVTESMLAAAELARQESFATSAGAHLGIGSLALVLFGNEPLRDRYLPDLAAARRIGAYALTEPGAGSDALSVTTRATKVSDGFLLDGRKQFITNAGIAGLYTVFAKVDGSAFSAFVVPAESSGLSFGPRERKMGMKGSPTASVVLESVHVDADHLLGEVGGGHRVAFGILNLGRIKLGFGSLGCARDALAHAARYAAERRQFGTPIGEFPLMRTKLADMATKIFLLEGACVRVVRALDAELPAGFGDTPPAQATQILRRFAVPSALLKILGSEYLCAVVDDAVQIHGGYGFIEEYPVCRMYRDVRINRIFEGTNEINRLLAAGGLLKQGLAGDWPLADLLASAGGSAPHGAPGAAALCDDLRWALGRLAGAAMERLGAGLEGEQTVLAGIADLALEIFALDTALARIKQAGPAVHEAMVLLGAEAARGRALGTLARLGPVLLDAGDTARLIAPFAAGASSAGEARDEVARFLVDHGGLA